MSDPTLIRKEKVSNENQFSFLVSEYKEKIYRLAGKFFKDRVDREEIVQETFLRVYISLNRLDKNRNVSAWIYRIGTNICIDTLRRRAVRQAVILQPVGEKGSSDLMDMFPSNSWTPEESVLNKELKLQIEEIMNELPPKWKPFIYQRYVLEMSLEEMSIANDMPVSTIKSRLYRARSYLKRRYEQL